MTKPLNVLHLTFDMRIGGTEQVIVNIVRMFRNSNISMSILCIESPIGPFGEKLLNEGTSVKSLSRKEGFDTSLIRKVRDIVTAENIDILHCHQYTPWVYGCLASFGLSTKVVFTEHGRFYPDSSSWKRYFINRLLERRTAKITAISKATKSALCEYEFLKSDNISVVYNGIAPLKVDEQAVEILKSTLPLTINDNTIILGTIARLDPIKNHTMMVEAFAKLVNDNINAVLIIVGDGEERKNIEDKIRELGVSNRVLLTGYKREPASYLGLMDIYLLSSLSEGTSMTLLEAMSIGKPCVVTNAGGNPEIVIDNENGLVTRNDDANDYFSAIKQLCADDKLRNKMSVAATERFFQLFHVEKMAEEFRDIYLSI